MITEDYVSFETSKLLKEKGFKGTRLYFYEKGRLIDCHNYWWRITPKERYEAIEAPTLQMAMKWLRLVHNILIVINGNPSDSLLYISIYKKDPYYDEWVPAESDTSLVYTGETIYEKNFKKYEDACEAAIKHCLTKII